VVMVGKRRHDIARWNGIALIAEASGTERGSCGASPCPPADVGRGAVGEGRARLVRWNGNQLDGRRRPPARPRSSTPCGSDGKQHDSPSEPRGRRAVGLRPVEVGTRSRPPDSPDDPLRRSAPRPKGIFAVGPRSRHASRNMTARGFPPHGGPRFTRRRSRAPDERTGAAAMAVGLAGAVYRYDGSLTARSPAFPPRFSSAVVEAPPAPISSSWGCSMR